MKRTVRWWEWMIKANRIAIDKGLVKLREISASLKNLKGYEFQSKADEGMEFVKELLLIRNQNQLLEKQIKEARARGLKRFSDEKLLKRSKVSIMSEFKIPEIDKDLSIEARMDIECAKRRNKCVEQKNIYCQTCLFSTVNQNPDRVFERINQFLEWEKQNNA